MTAPRATPPIAAAALVAAAMLPLATAAVAPLRAKAESVGLGDFTPLWAGQNTSGCEEISAVELTQKLASLVD